MDQLTLPLSRSTDPDTSHDAAVRARQFQSRHEALIWCALCDYGPMIPAEIAAHTRLDSVAVSRRGAGMERKGLVRMGPDVRDGFRVWTAIRTA